MRGRLPPLHAKSNIKAELWTWKQAAVARLARERLTIHVDQAQVLPTACGIPWLGFVVYPTHRQLKRRNAVNFTRRFERNLDAYQAGALTFAELDATVHGWINHVCYADTWGLREHMFSMHQIPKHAILKRFAPCGGSLPRTPSGVQSLR